MNKLKIMKIVKKPWGAEMWFAQVPGKYLGKVLSINATYRTSLHYHKKKEETMLVVSGLLHYIDGEGTLSLHEVGAIVHIPSGVRHSLGAGDRDLLLFEVSTCDPADSIRVFDYLGRKCEERK